jgi:hypothetical protein
MKEIDLTFVLKFIVSALGIGGGKRFGNRSGAVCGLIAA